MLGEFPGRNVLCVRGRGLDEVKTGLDEEGVTPVGPTLTGGEVPEHTRAGPLPWHHTGCVFPPRFGYACRGTSRLASSAQRATVESTARYSMAS